MTPMGWRFQFDSEDRPPTSGSSCRQPARGLRTAAPSWYARSGRRASVRAASNHVPLAGTYACAISAGGRTPTTAGARPTWAGAVTTLTSVWISWPTSNSVAGASSDGDATSCAISCSGDLPQRRLGPPYSSEPAYLRRAHAVNQALIRPNRVCDRRRDERLQDELLPVPARPARRRRGPRPRCRPPASGASSATSAITCRRAGRPSCGRGRSRVGCSAARGCAPPGAEGRSTRPAREAARTRRRGTRR